VLESDDPVQAWSAVKRMSLNEVDLLCELLDVRDEYRARKRDADRDEEHRRNG